MLPENALLKFKVPEVEEIEVVLVRLDDGSIVARTREELEKRGLPTLEEVKAGLSLKADLGE